MEVMASSKEVFVVMRRHEKRSLVEQLDFCTSPGPDRAIAEGFDDLRRSPPMMALASPPMMALASPQMMSLPSPTMNP